MPPSARIAYVLAFDQQAIAFPDCSNVIFMTRAPCKSTR